MKQCLMLLVVLIASCVTARAEVYEGNPDKMPSIGLNYSGMTASGDSVMMAEGDSTSQSIDATNGELTLDFRLPVSNALTLNAAIGSVSTKFTAKETPILLGNEAKTNGFAFQVGVRYYLH